MRHGCWAARSLALSRTFPTNTRLLVMLGIRPYCTKWYVKTQLLESTFDTNLNVLKANLEY